MFVSFDEQVGCSRTFFVILDETKEPVLISGMGTHREEYLVLCCDPANRRPVVMAKSNPIAEAPIPG